MQAAITPQYTSPATIAEVSPPATPTMTSSNTAMPSGIRPMAIRACPCPNPARVIKSGSANRRPISRCSLKIAYARSASPPISAWSASGASRKPRATQSRRPSSMAARARPTQPPARAHSPRFINPNTSQNPARAAPSGSPWRIRSWKARSHSEKPSSSRPVR